MITYKAAWPTCDPSPLHSHCLHARYAANVPDSSVFRPRPTVGGGLALRLLGYCCNAGRSSRRGHSGTPAEEPNTVPAAEDGSRRSEKAVTGKETVSGEANGSGRSDRKRSYRSNKHESRDDSDRKVSAECD